MKPLNELHNLKEAVDEVISTGCSIKDAIGFLCLWEANRKGLIEAHCPEETAFGATVLHYLWKRGMVDDHGKKRPTIPTGVEWNQNVADANSWSSEPVTRQTGVRSPTSALPMIRELLQLVSNYCDDETDRHYWGHDTYHRAEDIEDAALKIVGNHYPPAVRTRGLECTGIRYRGQNADELPEYRQ